MEDILNRYCQKSDRGLLLLSMPTGFGKTYNVLNFIYSNYQEFAQQNRKIIFITSLKKNLPINEFKNRFIADGQPEEFTNHVLFIDSNTHTLKNNLLKIANKIPEQFQTENYKKLKSHIETIENNKLPKTVQDILEKEIDQCLEPRFRQSIESKLNEKFCTK